MGRLARPRFRAPAAAAPAGLTLTLTSTLTLALTSPLALPLQPLQVRECSLIILGMNFCVSVVILLEFYMLSS